MVGKPGFLCCINGWLEKKCLLVNCYLKVNGMNYSELHYILNNEFLCEKALCYNLSN